MTIDHHSASTTSGRYSGSGDAGTFNMSLSPMWERAASLGAAAGVYTRSTSNGYAMTMTIHADGQLSASDPRGCVIRGPIAVPDKLQFASALPKTRSGKIMRRILRKIAENAIDQIGDTTTLADPGVVDMLVKGRL